MLHITAPEIIYLVTESFYLLAVFSHLFYLLPQATTNPFSVFMSLVFQMPHKSDIIQYLSFSV